MRRNTSGVLYLICFPRKIAIKHKVLSLFKKGIGRKIVVRTELCMKNDITYIYILNWVISARKMMSLTQNDWGQNDIINKIMILTKRVTYTIHAAILIKYQKHHSTTIVKHVNSLAKLNYSPCVCLLNMKPYDAYSITIHVCKMTIADISHKQKGVHDTIYGL